MKADRSFVPLRAVELNSTEALAFTIDGPLNVVPTNTLSDAKTSFGCWAYGMTKRQSVK